MPSPGKKLTLLAATVAVVVIGVTTWIAWPHIVFRWRFESLGMNEQGYLEYKHRQTGIVMVRLPGGTFWMGAQSEDPGGRNYDLYALNNEGPVHEVKLSAFLISKCETSQAQWKAVMGSDPSQFKGDDSRPVEQISWDDIQDFEAKTGLMLPRESQWEHACRGETSEPHKATANLNDSAWYEENSGDRTHPVGQKQANQFGLYDMHGNVFEWCEDVFNGTFYSEPEAAGPDPVATWGSGSRVLRGGGWGYNAGSCRPSFRVRYPPSYRRDHVGFRAAYCPLP